MKKKFFLLLTFLIIFLNTVKTQNLILDDLSVDNDQVLVTFHNYPDDITDNINLIVDKKENEAFKLTLLNVKNLYYIIIDNSGSINERDIEFIKEKILFFLKNIKKEDLVNIDKVNDYRVNIYKLNILTEEATSIISKIKREGTYSRLYDTILDSYNELLKIKKSDSYKDYNYYLIFFSDGEDIESKNKGKKILELKGIPFFFFCYGESYNEELTRPFIELSNKTNGKFLKEPTNEEIKKIFFDNENRYLLRFSIDKNKIIKSKEYIVTIRRKDNPSNKIEFDLKKFFPDYNDKEQRYNFNLFNFKFALKINLLPFIIGIIILLLIIILFLLIRRLVIKGNITKNKGFSKKEKESITLQSQNNTTIVLNNNQNLQQKQNQTTEEQKTNVKTNTIINKSNIGNKKDPILTQILKEKDNSIIVEYKTLKDNCLKRKYNKFQIFHSQHTAYIDLPEHTGEEIVIDSLFKIINIEKDWMEVESEKMFLIDEDIIINYLMFKVEKIKYNIQTDTFIIKLYSLNENKDLTDFFKISKEIVGTKKRKIFGSKDAIIESLLKKTEEMPIINDSWLKGELKLNKEKLILISNSPIFLDVIISVKYNELVNQYIVEKIEKCDDKFYIYLR